MLGLLKKHRFLIFLSLLFIFLRLPSLFEPYWYGDEGIYLTLGEGIRKGLVLYNQIHDNKPPTLYYLAAISQTVFGFRLLLLLIMIPTIYFFYRLCLKFFSHNLSKIATLIFLILTSIPLFEGNIANAEVFMLLPTILGFLIFLNAKKPISYFISALLLGYAFTIKIPVAFEFLFLFIYLFLDKLNLLEKFNFKNFFNKIRTHFLSFLLFVVGFIIPIALWAIYFYFHGAIKPFLIASLLQNFGYLSSWSTGSFNNSAASGGLLTRFIFLLLAWLFIYFLRLRNHLDQKISFLLFWFSATIFSVLLSTRPYPHYLIQLIPPLTLILIALFSKIKIFPKALMVFSLIILSSLLFKYKFYFYPVFSYYKNFYSYSLHLKNKTDYYSYFGSNVNTTYNIANYLNQNLTKDHIFIWGDEPYIYPLTNTLPIGRFTVAYHVVDFNAYNETIDKIKSHPPQYIVYYPMNNRPFSELDKIINSYYYPVKVFNSVVVFKLR